MKIILNETQLHRVIKESVGKILNEMKKETVQKTYDELRRHGWEHGNRPESYKNRAENLSDNYSDVYGDELDENPTPEDFFENLCVYAHGGEELQCGWFVDAITYGDDVLMFYENEEDMRHEEEPSYSFKMDEPINYKFEKDSQSDKSVVEELYEFGENFDFDEEKTLNAFASHMLS